MYFNFTLDSFKWRIALNRVTIKEEELLKNIVSCTMDEETGEIFYEGEFVDSKGKSEGEEGFNPNDELSYTGKFKNKSFRVEEKGIKTKYLLEKVDDSSQRSVESLAILINAKTLKNDYFTGINSENISDVYHYLMSQNIVEFDFRTFLDGVLSDIDFKSDFELKNPSLLIKELEKRTIPSKNREKGSEKFLRFDNMGIMWSKRESATASNPFIKIYGKSIELRKISSDFAQAFLAEKFSENIFRIEYTIKNKKHFRDGTTIYKTGKQKISLSDIPMKLKDILSFSNDQKIQMYKELLSRHIILKGSTIMDNKKREGLSPSELVLLGFIDAMRTNEISLSYILESAFMYFDDNVSKQSRSQWKKKLESLYYDFYKGDSEEEKIEQIEVSLFLSESDII